MKTKTELLKILKKEFPNCWFKDGEDFSSSHKNSIWSGEGSHINGENLVDDYTTGKKYILGVHHKMDAFLTKHGWYHELYDSGTVFFYPNP